MARLALIAALLAAGCDKLTGLDVTPAPLATLQVEVAGDPPPGASLRVALVWGAQWLPEAFCVLPAESEAAAAVIAAGCPDSFGFVPARVAASAAVGADGRAALDLFQLPAADVMVGDVAARVAYGSLVLFDDRNGDETLDLRRSRRDPAPDAGPGDTGDAAAGGPPDVVYGASFISMTLPDRRIAFREGGWDATAAFYPRDGCPPPAPGFSLLAAGGFTAQAAIAAALESKLPSEDPASCSAAPLAGAVIPVSVQDPSTVSQIACVRRSGYPRYREPPEEQRSIGPGASACASLPRLPGDAGGGAGIVQLVVAGAPDDPCPTVWHYLLRGCDNDPTCASPEWDRTASPPAWWPCH